jgi:hypothetical protein
MSSLDFVLLAALAVIVGALIPVQAATNAAMSRVVGSVAITSLVLFAIGFVVVAAWAIVMRVPLPSLETLRLVPAYCYFGGFIVASYVIAITFLAPQLGVVDVGENSVNVYLINKHYEPAPVLSMTQHEANNAILWISDKLWQSLNDDQKKWVLEAGRDVTTQEPKKAFDLERSAADKLKAIGIKIVTDVDKSGFSKISDPMLDKLAKELGPHADKIKNLIKSIQ